MTDSQFASYDEAKKLSDKLIASLDNQAWRAHTTPEVEQWYLELLSKMLVLLRGENVEYITSWYDVNRGHVLLFTRHTIIEADVDGSERGAVAVSVKSFGRRNLVELSVDRVTSVTSDGGKARAAIITLTYPTRKLTLPLTPFASLATSEAVEDLIPSFIEDLNSGAELAPAAAPGT